MCSEGDAVTRRAFCRACGVTVEITESGRCANGHGPEWLETPPGQPAAYTGPVARGAVTAGVASSPQSVGVVGAQRKRMPRAVLVLIIVGVVLVCLIGCCVAAGYVATLGDEETREEYANVTWTFTKALVTGDRHGLEEALPEYVAEEMDQAVWEMWEDAAGESRFAVEESEWSGDQLVVRGRYDGRALRVRIAPSGTGFWEDYDPRATIGVRGGGPWPAYAWLYTDDAGRIYVYVVEYGDVEYYLEEGDLPDLLEAVARDRGAPADGESSEEPTQTQ